MHLSVAACLVVCSAVFGIACGSPPTTHAAPASAPAPAPVTATPAPQHAPNASTPEGSSATGPRCRFSVTNTLGCAPSRVEALIEPIRPRIEACHGSGGGKVRIRVRQADGKLAFEVEPGTSLDPTEKRCVLDALSTIRDSEQPSGPDVKASGFTSLITVEW